VGIIVNCRYNYKLTFFSLLFTVFVCCLTAKDYEVLQNYEFTCSYVRISKLWEFVCFVRTCVSEIKFERQNYEITFKWQCRNQKLWKNSNSNHDQDYRIGISTKQKNIKKQYYQSKNNVEIKN